MSDQLPEEPLYGNEEWQQQLDEEQRRAEEERCDGCTADAGWPCKTTLRGRGGAKPIYLGCRKDAQARYADGGKPTMGNVYEYHGPEAMGSDGKFHREMRLK